MQHAVAKHWRTRTGYFLEDCLTEVFHDLFADFALLGFGNFHWRVHGETKEAEPQESAPMFRVRLWARGRTHGCASGEHDGECQHEGSHLPWDVKMQAARRPPPLGMHPYMYSCTWQVLLVLDLARSSHTRSKTSNTTAVGIPTS